MHRTTTVLLKAILFFNFSSCHGHRCGLYLCIAQVGQRSALPRLGARDPFATGVTRVRGANEWNMTIMERNLGHKWAATVDNEISAYESA